MPDESPLVLPHRLTSDCPSGEQLTGEHYAEPGFGLSGVDHTALEDLHVGDLVELYPNMTARRHPE